MSKKSRQMAAAPVQREAVTPGRSLAPPTFQLQSSGSDAIQRTENPKIRKSHRDQLEYGPAETGPIAHKGHGDAHEFAANDIHQGALGDCYFLAGLQSIAHTQPDLLKNAITDNGDGTYTVRLYKRTGLFGGNLTQKSVTINSEFVVSKAWGSNAYASGGDRDASFNEEMWVRLFEKAYAKLHGGFDKIDGGFEDAALEALTGQNYTMKNFNGGFLGIGKMKTEDMKKAVIDQTSNGEPVNCGTKGQKAIDKHDQKEGHTFAADNNIVGRHAYTIMYAGDGKLTVRNPHGDFSRAPEVDLSWEQFRAYFSRFTQKK